jgi:hypothetical protein
MLVKVEYKDLRQWQLNLQYLALTQRSRLDRLSSLWLAIRQPVTIMKFAKWYLIVSQCSADVALIFLLPQTPPNCFAKPTPIKLQMCHVVVFGINRGNYSWFNYYCQLCFEIMKVTWKSGCKKANPNCVLLQAGDMENYCLQ